MATKTRQFIDDGWAIWIDGDDRWIPGFEEITCDVSDLQDKRYKVFFWDGKGFLAPICDVYEHKNKLL